MAQSLLGKKIKTFSIIKLIGQGSFAAVFQAIDESTNKLVAVKVMRIQEYSRSKKLKQLVKTQVAVLKACKNGNVISFVDSFEVGDYLFIITEFCNEGDLEQYLRKKKITQDQAVAFLKQILNGFKGLHQVGAMHRDFKTANVLLNDGVCKIADLGFSKQMEENSITKTILGTSVTMAPQILQEIPYGFSADVWSIGVVFYQMIFGKYPFYGKNDFDLLKNIKTNRPSFEGMNISQRARDFLEKCLTVDPKKRICWKQIYRHPLIVERQRVSMTAGALRSAINIKTNRDFYENINLPSDQDKDVIINSLRDIEQSESEQRFPIGSVQPLLNVDILHQKLAEAKNKQQIIERFDNLYVSKRNDLMFYTKFIQPYVESVKQLPINHEIPNFLLSKKCYKQLQDFLSSIRSKRLIFYNQNGFEVYNKQTNYGQVQKQVAQDILSVQQHCKQYGKMVREKVTTLSVSSELDYKVVRGSNYDGLLNQVLREYSKLLTIGLSEITDMGKDKEKEKLKKDLLRVIEALNYYTGNPRIHSDQFDRNISTANFETIEKNMRRKSLK